MSSVAQEHRVVLINAAQAVIRTGEQLWLLIGPLMTSLQDKSSLWSHFHYLFFLRWQIMFFCTCYSKMLVLYPVNSSRGLFTFVKFNYTHWAHWVSVHKVLDSRLDHVQFSLQSTFWTQSKNSNLKILNSWHYLNMVPDSVLDWVQNVFTKSTTNNLHISNSRPHMNCL